MILYCVRTDAESGVASWPSNAARTSSASSCLPFRMRRRGESGRNGHSAYIQNVKKSWKANGNRQAISRGAKEKARVSQLLIENPVMQFAVLSEQIYHGNKGQAYPSGL